MQPSSCSNVGSIPDQVDAGASQDDSSHTISPAAIPRRPRSTDSSTRSRQFAISSDRYSDGPFARSKAWMASTTARPMATGSPTPAWTLT